MGTSNAWPSRLWHSRWLLMVTASWLQACTGLNVMYATFSTAIKASLGYNQTQISRLGVAKDLGNAAEIIAGCLSQVLSTRGLLFLGGFQFLLGYGFLWLIVVNKIPAPSFWMVFFLLFIGSNAPKYLDIATVISCLPSFPDSRGSLLGVLRAFKGGAIFSHVYSTFFSPLRSASLLIVAIGPTLVAFITSPIVRPVGRASEEDKITEDNLYGILYAICLLIAGYMVFLILFQSGLPAGDYRSVLMFSGMLALVLSPLVVALISVTFQSKKADSTIEAGLNEALLQGDSDEPRILLQGSEDNAEMESTEEKPTSSTTEPPVIITSVPFWRKGGKVPPLGEEVTLLQALRTVEFWLLFMALYCGLGSSSTALDNLGQMAQAQGYENTQTFVSIFSISSYIGHLFGGYMSEVVVRNGLPRPVSLIITQGTMILALFLFAMAWPGSFYLASVCLGLSCGSFSSINPAISSELFGLMSFGPIFGVLSLSAPASSTVLAGLVAGKLYDREAEKQQSSECTGKVCFYLTCWIMVGVCAVGMVLSAALSWRARGVYKKKKAETGTIAEGPRDAGVREGTTAADQ